MPTKWQYGPRTQGHCLDCNSTADLARALRKVFDLPVGPLRSSGSCNLPWPVFETTSDEPIVPFAVAKGGSPPSVVLLTHRCPLALALALHARWRWPASPAAPASASRERPRVHEARSGGLLGGPPRCALSSGAPSSPQHQANSSAPTSISAYNSGIHIYICIYH